MKKLKSLLLVALMFVGYSAINGQTEKELYELGLKYEKEYNNKKMLGVFKKLVEMDSTNANYLAYLSFAYSKVGANVEDDALKMKYYHKAKSIAADAKKIDDNNAMAHYSYALALARENENAKTKVKISNAKEIKAECDKAIALDPSLPGPYHIMGRWHRTFAGFSSFEKTMVNTFYGGTPKGGTYKDALEMFQKAIELEPNYMLHTYELAVTYHDMGKDDYAIKFLEKAMTLPHNYEDGEKCYEDCKKLLAELKK